MAACAAVFGTCELIESVLAELTPFEVGTALLVCSTWRNIIKESKHIAYSGVVAPERSIKKAEGPIYTSSIGIKMNPDLPSAFNVPGSGAGIYTSAVRTTAGEFGCLNSLTPDDFVSYPPVQTVHVLLSDKEGVNERLWTRIEGGVRIGHLQGLVAKRGGNVLVFYLFVGFRRK